MKRKLSILLMALWGMSYALTHSSEAKLIAKNSAEVEKAAVAR